MCLSLSPHSLGNLAVSEVHFQPLFGSKIYKFVALPLAYHFHVKINNLNEESLIFAIAFLVSKYFGCRCLSLSCRCLSSV